MPKRDPNLPGDVVFTPGSWQQALIGLLVELTKLAANANRAIDDDRARR